MRLQQAPHKSGSRDGALLLAAVGRPLLVPAAGLGDVAMRASEDPDALPAWRFREERAALLRGSRVPRPSQGRH